MNTSNWILKAEMNMESVRKQYQDELEGIKNTFPNWPEDDARRWLISRMATTLFFPILGLYLMRHCLTNNAFWENYSPGTGEILAKGGREAFNRGLRGYLILTTVGNLEHSLKVILHHLNPDIKVKQFYNVYHALFRKENPYLKNIPSDWLPTFELMRVLRNCHHSSWVYIPDESNKKSKKIIFQTKEYVFYSKCKVDFVSWDLMTDLMLDILRIVKELIRDPHIIKIDYIEDWGAGDIFKHPQQDL